MASFPIKPRVPAINWEDPITRGLVLDCPLFEGGGVTPKEVANKFPSTLVGTPSWVKTAIGNAMTFNTNQAVKFTHNSRMAAPNGRTLECMYVSNGAQAVTANILYKNGSYIIRYVTGNSLRWLPWAGGSPLSINFSHTPTTGVIYHIACTQIVGSQKVYLNGKLVASATTAGAINDDVNDFGIGGNPAGVEPWNGLVFYGRIWNRGLTQKEIVSLYINPWRFYLKDKIDVL